MPRMNRRELYEQVRGLRGDLKVIYISGYTEGAAILEADSHPNPAFLSKPFTLEALARKVREVLDGTRCGGAQA